jgi:hypothetical protein
MPINAELFKAVDEGDVDQVAAILNSVKMKEVVSYVNQTNDLGETPLHAIYLTNHKPEIIRKIAFILNAYGASDKILDDSGLTPAHYKEYRDPPKPMTIVERREARKAVKSVEKNGRI